MSLAEALAAVSSGLIVCAAVGAREVVRLRERVAKLEEHIRILNGKH